MRARDQRQAREDIEFRQRDHRSPPRNESHSDRTTRRSMREWRHARVEEREAQQMRGSSSRGPVPPSEPPPAWARPVDASSSSEEESKPPMPAKKEELKKEALKKRKSLREPESEVELSSPHSVRCRAAPSSTSPARPSRKVARKTSSPTSDVEFVAEEMDLMAPQPVKVERKGNSFEVTYRYSKRP